MPAPPGWGAACATPGVPARASATVTAPATRALAVRAIIVVRTIEDSLRRFATGSCRPTYRSEHIDRCPFNTLRRDGIGVGDEVLAAGGRGDLVPELHVADGHVAEPAAGAQPVGDRPDVHGAGVRVARPYE